MMNVTNFPRNLWHLVTTGTDNSTVVLHTGTSRDELRERARVMRRRGVSCRLYRQVLGGATLDTKS